MTVSAQYCYPADVFGDQGDIEGDWQAEYTSFACVDLANKNFKKGDTKNWNTTTNGVPYNYNIWWEDDCSSSVDTMNVYKPLGDKSDANCLDLMQNNYEKCKAKWSSQFALDPLY